MTRLVLNKVRQREFLIGVCKALEINTQQAGKLVGICGRNYRDWINGKLLPRKDAIKKLSEMSGIPIPTIIEEREEWWSGRVNGKKGGDACYKKYGAPGTNEDRRKGWLSTIENKKANPNSRWTIANEYKIPEYSAELAEFIGIVLGDGGLTAGQCEISLHMIDDIEYASYVSKLADSLFDAKSSIYSYPKHTVIKVVISGVNFVKILEGFGLQKGNKIRHQVDIPDWIKMNPDYLKACMRGLYDTDGTSFTHKHVILGHKYVHFGVGFCSASKPLLASYAAGMSKFGIEPHFNGPNIFCYGVKNSQKFFSIFRPSNPKYERRLLKYLSSGGSRLGKVK